LGFWDGERRLAFQLGALQPRFRTVSVATSLFLPSLSSTASDREGCALRHGDLLLQLKEKKRVRFGKDKKRKSAPSAEDAKSAAPRHAIFRLTGVIRKASALSINLALPVILI